jgi:membrane-bound serine protease (ClpP class)
VQTFSLFLGISGLYLKFVVLSGVAFLFLLLLVVALSRHKKAGTRVLDLVGAIGTAHGDLAPRGFVIVRGELWPAISMTEEAHENGNKVLVVGVKLGRLAVSSALEKPGT